MMAKQADFEPLRKHEAKCKRLEAYLNTNYPEGTWRVVPWRESDFFMQGEEILDKVYVTYKAKDSSNLPEVPREFHIPNLINIPIRWEEQAPKIREELLTRWKEEARHQTR